MHELKVNKLIKYSFRQVKVFIDFESIRFSIACAEICSSKRNVNSCKSSSSSGESLSAIAVNCPSDTTLLWVHRHQTSVDEIGRICRIWGLGLVEDGIECDTVGVKNFCVCSTVDCNTISCPFLELRNISFRCVRRIPINASLGSVSFAVGGDWSIVYWRLTLQSNSFISCYSFFISCVWLIDLSDLLSQTARCFFHGVGCTFFPPTRHTHLIIGTCDDSLTLSHLLFVIFEIKYNQKYKLQALNTFRIWIKTNQNVINLFVLWIWSIII